MLTKDDLLQIKQVVKDVIKDDVDPKFQKIDSRFQKLESKMDRGFKKLDKKIGTSFNYLDRLNLNHEKRIERIEAHVGLPTQPLQS